MRKRYQVLLAVVAMTVLVAGLSLAAVAAQPFKGTTLRVVLSNHPWSDAIRPLIPEFEELTGIKVNAESYFEDQLTQKLLVEFASGTSTIDVFMQRPLQEAKQFQKNGWYTDLSTYVDKETEWDPKDFFPSALLAETGRQPASRTEPLPVFPSLPNRKSFTIGRIFLNKPELMFPLPWKN